MLEELITIIYASSPHRFGQSSTMIHLNHLINQTIGLQGCKFIICCDGINPNSNFISESEVKKYKNYLKKIEAEIPDLELIVSDNHLGLTKNYLQAWEQKKISTPYALLLNHDSIFTDEILSVDLQKLLNNWIEEVSCIMFPRSSFQGEIPLDWWRPQPIEGLKTLDEVSLMTWKNFRIAFGNQDNCCIYKTEVFPEVVNKFYKEKETHFIEDSIQEYLKNLDTKDLKNWGRFGGLVYEKGASVHLDGISKAGENFIQENNRGGEKVWSAGRLFPKHLSMLKKIAQKNPLVQHALDDLLRETIAFLHERNQSYISKLFDNTSNMCALTMFLEKKPLLNSPPECFKVLEEDLELPIQQQDICMHLEISPNKFLIKWEEPNAKEQKKLLLQANKKNGDRILFGGHPKNLCEFTFGEKVSKNDVLNILLFDYTHKLGKHPMVLEESLNLNFVEFGNNEVRLKCDKLSGKSKDISLYLCDQDGRDIEFKQTDLGLFEINSKDLASNTFFGFFYEYSQAEDLVIKSWSFEIHTPFFTDNAAEKIIDSYEKISKSIGLKNWEGMVGKLNRGKFWQEQFSAF